MCVLCCLWVDGALRVCVSSCVRACVRACVCVHVCVCCVCCVMLCCVSLRVRACVGTPYPLPATTVQREGRGGGGREGLRGDGGGEEEEEEEEEERWGWIGRWEKGRADTETESQTDAS